MNSHVSAEEAWRILEEDPRHIFARLAALPSRPRSIRLKAAEEDLTLARRKAKILMGRHHPDRGGDSKLFRRVQEALASIEHHLDEFKAAVERAEEKDRIRAAEREKKVFIKLD